MVCSVKSSPYRSNVSTFISFCRKQVFQFQTHGCHCLTSLPICFLAGSLLIQTQVSYFQFRHVLKLLLASHSLSHRSLGLRVLRSCDQNAGKGAKLDPVKGIVLRQSGHSLSSGSSLTSQIWPPILNCPIREKNIGRQKKKIYSVRPHGKAEQRNSVTPIPKAHLLGPNTESR